VHRQLPDDGEVAGLLAHVADRRAERTTTADGALVTLAEQTANRGTPADAEASS
jgi:hypothetical protein